MEEFKESINIDKSQDKDHEIFSLDIDNNNNKKYLEIITKDKKKIQVEHKYLKNSEVLNVLESCEDNEIELNYNESDINIIIDYLIFLHNNPELPKINQPIMDISLKTEVHPTELEFINLLFENKNLINILNIADFLHIQRLIELCAAKIATKFKHVKESDYERVWEENFN